MQLLIATNGTINCIYNEILELADYGVLYIVRGSYVEPTENGLWVTDLSPVSGPQFGPYQLRSEALNSERRWIEDHLETIALFISKDRPKNVVPGLLQSDGFEATPPNDHWDRN